MGWLVSKSWRNRSEMLAHLRAPSRFGAALTLLKSTAVGNNHWYLFKVGATGEIFIGLDLMRGGREGWGYKNLDETAGPTAVNCPLSYLKQASEPVGYAVEWRKRVQQYHASRLQKVAGAHVLYGDVHYVLVENRGRRGWRVSRLLDGSEFRMSCQQISAAVVVDTDKSTAVL